MSPVSIAYAHFRFGPEGIELELVYEDETRKRLPLASSGLDLSLARREQLFRAVEAAVAQACSELGVADPATLSVAVSCPHSWRETIYRALAQARCPEFDLLSPEAAESVHFFKSYEGRLLPIVNRWLARARDAGTQAGVREFESARHALVHRTMSVAVVGAMKAGKSTFLNALLGDFIMPATDKRCTRRRFVLSNVDEAGESGRRVTVTRLADDGGAVRDAVLSVNADEYDWTSAHILSYLFALNAPDLLRPGAELGRSEQKWLEEYRRLPLPPTRREELDRALAVNVAINTIRVTHPFYALTKEAVGRVEIWDTPGPDGVVDVVDSIEQRLSDRTHFERALGEASAAILIFDLMRNGGEAQHRVLADIARFRAGRANSLVLLANRVDERPASGVVPLQDQLEEIREDARRFHRLSLRPIVPLSARHAQYAREMLRGEATGQRNEERWDDLESVIRPADMRADRASPARAVETRSSIRQVEDLLRRFFRQEHGLSILQGACDKLGQVVGEHERTTERNLAALRVEKEDRERAATILGAGTTLFEQDLAVAMGDFQKAIVETRTAAAAQLQVTRSECIQAMAVFWDQEFGKNQEMSPRVYQQSIGPAMALLEFRLTKLNRELEEALDKQMSSRVRVLWSRLDAVVQRIERDIDRQLGIQVGGTTPRTGLPTDLFASREPPPLNAKTTTHRAKGEAKKGAFWGALASGAAAAVAAVTVIGSGGAALPVVIAAGAATAAGAGLGAGVGHARAQTATRAFYTRHEVHAAYRQAIETVFDKLAIDLAGQIEGVFSKARAEIEADAHGKLSTLREVLADAEKHAREQTRAERIEFLEGDLGDIRKDVATIRELGRRLGVSVTDLHRALASATAS
ncbi:MAG: dynamin family protein [Myxococcales bacterium]|nr:dynamin family protein [Myxococcales bacterium]